MNMKNNQFWFWGFIVLAILIVSAISTIGYKAYKFHNYDHSFNKEVSNKKHSKWSDLSFTVEQRSFIRKSRIDHRQNISKLKAQQRNIHNKLFTEISKEQSDSSLIKIYKDSSLILSDAIMNETMNFYETLKTELSEEQMQNINNHIYKRFYNKRSIN